LSDVEEIVKVLSDSYEVSVENGSVRAKHREIPIEIVIRLSEQECRIEVRASDDLLKFVEDFVTESPIDDLEDFIDDVERTVDVLTNVLSKKCTVTRDLKGVLDLRDAMEYYLEEVLE
jgi:predicted component of type VI protein secretion system